MRRPYYPWSLRDLLEHRHSVGGLLDLCEENYRYMLRLAPELGSLRGRHLSRIDGHIDLHLEVLEQTPYTTLIHLTYRFGEGGADPDALLRVYHDARQMEVLELRQRVLPLNRRPDMCSLERKWRLNLFLSKWLGYCCRQGHRFDAGATEVVEERIMVACL